LVKRVKSFFWGGSGAFFEYYFDPIREGNSGQAIFIQQELRKRTSGFMS